MRVLVAVDHHRDGCIGNAAARIETHRHRDDEFAIGAVTVVEETVVLVRRCRHGVQQGAGALVNWKVVEFVQHRDQSSLSGPM